MTILPTNNTDWGFWGSIASQEVAGVDPQAAWALAMEAVAGATGCPASAVRDFLDSRHGRHFADDVTNQLFTGAALGPATAAAVERWMGWRIDRRTAKETGIPVGLPYLTGFVALMEIEAEAA